MHESIAEKTEKLRNKISELKKQLEVATLEKGLAADENKDLRENSVYDYWDQKESILIIRIHRIMKEIRDLSPKKKPLNKPKHKKSAVRERVEYKPHKWL